jgi:hypothetical protein
MLGQFWVELELPVLPELPELELELEPDEPEVLLVPEPEFPEADVFGVLEEVELVEPEPDVVDVVAALATNAPPATRPEASAPVAMTLRNRICMDVALSRSGGAPAHLSERLHGATPTCGRAHIDIGACAELRDDSMTIVTILTARWGRPVPAHGNGGAR